jgi:eukaryotic-like serine/threonine-protein kinase
MSWNQGHLLKSGQYEVIRLLGSGGFGMTYLAKDLNLERQVVIKRPNWVSFLGGTVDEG